MCLRIDESVKSLNKRIVWKVFDKSGPNGAIVSLFQGYVYPQIGVQVERSHDSDSPFYANSDGSRTGNEGLHFYLSKARALSEAKTWSNSFIARFEVDPADFMFADGEGAAMYERATRVGPYIKVRGK